MERNSMRSAMLPGRSPEMANSFRRYLEGLFDPRDPSREYGAILPISSDPNVPGSGRFDLRGGFTGDILGMLGAGGRAMRGEAYDPMDITMGLMGTATPSLAARPRAGVLRSAGGGEPPRLPVELQAAAETKLAPENSLRASLQRSDAGILHPESNANAARYTSAEGREYAAKLQELRDAWGRVDWQRKIIDDYVERLREPGLTDQGIYKIQQRLQRARERYAESLKTAETLGLKENDPFPADIRLTAPHGQFPGDEKYAFRSYAPEGYPFAAGSHDFSDPKFRVPD